MKFDSDIKGLLKGVFTGCLMLCAVETAVGIGVCAARLFGLKADAMSVVGVILGSAGGTAVAMLVFLWMAASLQKSLNDAMLGGKAVRRGVQAGYTRRLLAQGIWVVIAALVPFINTICALIPLLFPKLAIYLLQITGKLNLTQKSQTVKTGGTEEGPEKTQAAVQERSGESAEDVSGDKGGEN